MADEQETMSVETLLAETPQAEPVTEQPKEAEPSKTEQPRDEQGKFAPKEAAKEAPKPETKVEPTPEPGKEQPDDKDGNVPSWRLREVAEARRAAETRAATLEAQLAQMNARLAVLDKPKEQPKQGRPDPLLDPEGYDKWIQDRVESGRSEDRLNFNLGLAHVKYGEKFEKAYNALLQSAQAGNRQLVNNLTSQANPGEAIVKWYSDQETLREVGGDPASYKQKLLDEALKNPEFLAKAIEAAKASAGQPGRQNNITQLPPSLSRVAGSSNNIEANDGEISVEAILGR